MDETELRDAFSRVVAAEPALALDADQVVAGGRARLRRRRMLIAVAAALVSAAMIVVPAALWHAGGTAPAGPGAPYVTPTLSWGTAPATGHRSTPRATPTSDTPYVTPTPGAPHGGCRMQTHSGSTEGAVFARWFVRQLPGTYQYSTDPGWQVSYQNDCVDGATFDTVEVGARVVGTDGDIVLGTARSVPAGPVRRPCTEHGPAVTAEAVPWQTSPATPAVSSTNSTSQAPPKRVPGSLFDRCQTQHRPDGSTVTIEESHDPEMGERSRSVIWWGTDGTSVALYEDNRHVLDDSTRNPRLVLTVDQMIALVTDPAVLVYLPPPR